MGRIGKKLTFWLGGGKIEFRVRGCRVEMRGGGTGPFWGFAHFTDFNSPTQAEHHAAQWRSKAQLGDSNVSKPPEN